MVNKGQLFALHGEPEVELFFVFVVFLADLLLKFCKMDDYFVFAGEAADSCHNAEGITDVDCENPVEKSYDKAEFNAFFSKWIPRKWMRINDSTTAEEVDEFCKYQEQLIGKPIEGSSGVGIQKYTKENWNNGGKEFLNTLRKVHLNCALFSPSVL